MVELFTVESFSPSRRGGHAPVPSVARRQLPTPAALNELAEASPNPTDGILQFTADHLLCAIDVIATAEVECTNGFDFADAASLPSLPGDKVCPRRPHFLTQLLRHAYWIERRDYFDAIAASNKGNSDLGITPTSLH